MNKSYEGEKQMRKYELSSAELKEICNPNT